MGFFGRKWTSLARSVSRQSNFPVDPNGFATRDQIVDYFVAYAEQIAAPIRCGIEVTALRAKADGSGFRAETPEGIIEATNVVVATGPFQRPLIPNVVPSNPGSSRSIPPTTGIPPSCAMAQFW